MTLESGAEKKTLKELVYYLLAVAFGKAFPTKLYIQAKPMGEFFETYLFKRERPLTW